MENVKENENTNITPSAPVEEPAPKKNNDARKKELIKRWVINLMPIVALGILFAVYMILLIVNDYKISMSLTAFINQAIIIAFVATGALFIFTLGSFDISLGASTLFSATIGVMVYISTGSVFAMFIVCILVAVACSLLNSVIAAVFHLPMFVTTVAMLSVLTAVASNIIQTEGSATGTSYAISVPYAMRAGLETFNSPIFKLIVLAVFALICVFVFEFTKIGRKQKFLGGNPICAKMSGISVSIFGIIAFVMAGIGVGLGAGMTIVYAPSVSTTTAGSIGMSVFIAIVFGGMPISGGARSRIYAALVGGTSYILLQNILNILLQSMGGARDGWVQLISAIMFLAVVFVTGMNYRTKNLPR